MLANLSSYLALRVNKSCGCEFSNAARTSCNGNYKEVRQIIRVAERSTFNVIAVEVKVMIILSVTYYLLPTTYSLLLQLVS